MSSRFKRKTALLSMALGLFFAFLSACQSVYVSEEPSGIPPEQSSAVLEDHNAQVDGSFSHPRQIALLLPLTGKHASAAKAIQEGFLASYYSSSGGFKPVVRIYDTTRDRDVQRAYELAVQEGASFVVGPLDKDDVRRLSMGSLRTPVLALNQHPMVHSSSHFVQFALSPEDEAEQIAEKAKQKGYNNASIIVPDNAWGRRIAQAFSHRWHSMGGRTLNTVYANPLQDQSVAVRQLLGVVQNPPAKKGEKPEPPRRRQDIDVIVMAAHPDQARQLKPLFDFYYADNVPVYATSSVYSGTPNPNKDRDLNGVIFCDMPWLIDTHRASQMRQLLQRNGSSSSEQYSRLFAMGVDAYQLTQQLGRLSPGASYQGVTGNLTVGSHYQIQRQLAWAKMVNGVPVSVY